jgi:hypothetical protein
VAIVFLFGALLKEFFDLPTYLGVMLHRVPSVNTDLKEFFDLIGTIMPSQTIANLTCRQIIFDRVLSPATARHNVIRSPALPKRSAANMTSSIRLPFDYCAFG